jgi:phage terminase Nu1 subunit (DNA packaging protein)
MSPGLKTGVGKGEAKGSARAQETGMGENIGEQETVSELMPVDVPVELAELVRTYPLPDGVRDADMNQAELAAAFNTSVNTIGKYLSAPENPMPVVQVGANGRPYVLRLSHCFAWKMAREANERARTARARGAIEALQATFLGLDVDDEHVKLSAQERRALADADIAYSRAQHMRRQLVRLEDVTELIESMFKIIRDGIQSMPDRLERELNLKPEEVMAVQRVGSDVLTGLVEKIEEAELAEREIEDVEVQTQWTI